MLVGLARLSQVSQAHVVLLPPNGKHQWETFRATVREHYGFPVSYSKNGQWLVSKCMPTFFRWSRVCLWKHFKHVIYNSITQICQFRWNETKTDWKVSPSPHSAQAARHCRFRPRQSNIEAIAIMILCLSLYSTEFRPMVKVLEPIMCIHVCISVSPLCCPVQMSASCSCIKNVNVNVNVNVKC